MNHQKIVKWDRQISKIQYEIRELLQGRKIFLETLRIIESNNEVKKNIFTWLDYYKVNSTYFTLSKIYHQIDEDPNADNLFNLLNDLHENCSMVTARWWVEDGKSLSINTFKEKFGGLTLSPSNVYGDLGDLIYTTKDIKIKRDKILAHRDRSKKTSTEISIEEVNKAIDLINDLGEKYTLLIQKRSLSHSFDSDWQKSFVIPWIEDKNASM